MEIFFFKYIGDIASETNELGNSVTGDTEHFALLEALEDGNTELARGLLKKHLSRYMEIVG